MQHRSANGLRSALLAAVFATVLTPALVHAAVPVTALVEGMLRSTAGGPATDGNYTATFRIYTEAAAVQALWTEGPIVIAVKSGHFTQTLGVKSALSQQVISQIGAEAWMGIQIGEEPELPRQPLNSVLFALRTETADSLACSGCLTADHIDAKVLAPYAKTAALAAVATSGKFADLEGGPDLSPYAQLASLATVATTGKYTDLVGAPDISAYAKTASLAKVATTGAYADLANAPTLSKVATTGAYADLGNAPTLPKLGVACGTGLVMKGLKADGTYECVAAITENALPTNGLNEVSNGLLWNQYTDSYALASALNIPDNNPTGISTDLTVLDSGVAEALTVNLELVNSKINTLVITLVDPASTTYTLHNKTGTGTSLKTSYPTPTKAAVGDLTTWVSKNPKGKWTLKVVDTDFLNNTNDGQIKSFSIDVKTLSSTKVTVKGDLVIDGNLYAANFKDPELPETAQYRYAFWGPTYDYANSWLAGNNSDLFGGVAPSTWSDSNGLAASLTSNKPLLRALFNRKGYGGPNAMIISETYREHGSSTSGKHAGVLFRVKNSTAANINWAMYFYYTSYASWNEYPSIAVNGSNIWAPASNCASNCTVGQTVTMLANRVNTVVVVVGSGPPFTYSSSTYGYQRPLMLGFYNNSLALPAGLSFVDDLSTVSQSSGWEQ